MRGRRLDLVIVLVLVLGGVLFGHVAGAADGTVAANGGSGSSSHGGSSHGSGSNGSSNHGTSNHGTSDHGSSGTSGSHTSTTTGSGGTATTSTGGGDTTSEPGATQPSATTEPSGTGTTEPSSGGTTTTASSTGPGVLTGPTVTSIVGGDNRAGGSTSDVNVTVVDIDVNTGQRVTRIEPRYDQAPLATLAALCIFVVLVGIIAIAVSEANRQR